VFGPIRPTAADVEAISDELVRQLVVHNETGAALCGWEAVEHNGRVDVFVAPSRSTFRARAVSSPGRWHGAG